MTSFLHRGSSAWASYRYRAQRPAAYLGWALNDPTAETLIFSKPHPDDVPVAEQAKQEGRHVIVDFCDWHARPEYEHLLQLADAVTCPTSTMAQILDVPATVIPDPYEFPPTLPHVTAQRRLSWFGHGSNYYSIRPYLSRWPIRIMSNLPGTEPWNLLALRRLLSETDIVVLPTTAPWKSPNRAIEAIQCGCMVVAEPHPGLMDLPIWIGSLEAGVDWATTNPQLANQMIVEAQAYVQERFSLPTCSEAWRRVAA